MNRTVKISLPQLAAEMVVYAVLVSAYYFCVLHFLGNSLEHLYRDRRGVYAGLALGLIVAQGLLLEILTRFLLSWIQPRRRQE